MKLRTHPFLLFTLALSLFLVSCDKNNSTGDGKARMQVLLTDDPGDYKQVFIDIEDVQINYSTDLNSGWTSLNGVSAGSYDLLRLVNDNDTMLANSEVQTGRIEQIRLVLGSDNYIIDNDGVRHDLQTPSAQQSGLKLNIHQDVNEGILCSGKLPC